MNTWLEDKPSSVLTMYRKQGTSAKDDVVDNTNDLFITDQSRVLQKAEGELSI